MDAHDLKDARQAEEELTKIADELGAVRRERDQKKQMLSEDISSLYKMQNAADILLLNEQEKVLLTNAAGLESRIIPRIYNKIMNGELRFDAAKAEDDLLNEENPESYYTPYAQEETEPEPVPAAGGSGSGDSRGSGNEGFDLKVENPIIKDGKACFENELEDLKEKPSTTAQRTYDSKAGSLFSNNRDDYEQAFSESKHSRLNIRLSGFLSEDRESKLGPAGYDLSQSSIETCSPKNILNVKNNVRNFVDEYVNFTFLPKRDESFAEMLPWKDSIDSTNVSMTMDLFRESLADSIAEELNCNHGPFGIFNGLAEARVCKLLKDAGEQEKELLCRAFMNKPVETRGAAMKSTLSGDIFEMLEDRGVDFDTVNMLQQNFSFQNESIEAKADVRLAAVECTSLVEETYKNDILYAIESLSNDRANAYITGEFSGSDDVFKTSAILLLRADEEVGVSPKDVAREILFTMATSNLEPGAAKIVATRTLYEIGGVLRPEDISGFASDCIKAMPRAAHEDGKNGVGILYRANFGETVNSACDHMRLNLAQLENTIGARNNDDPER